MSNVKHPLQLSLERRGIPLRACQRSCYGEQVPGVAVPLANLDKVGALIVMIMDDIVGSHSDEEASVRASAREAIANMCIDTYPFPRGIIVWFPVNYVEG